MTTLLPIDSQGHAIPALRLKPGGAHSIAAGASASRTASAFDPATKIVSVYADVPVYLKFGDSGVTAAATDHYFPAGYYYDFAIAGGAYDAPVTHLSVLAAEDSGTVYLSEKE